MVWDNAPAHRGEALREYLRTADLNLRLVNLPAYSPDFNANEPIWGWAREEATGNLYLGPGRRFRRGLRISWWVWLTGKKRSGVAAGRLCNQGLRGSRKISSPIPAFRQMHIPPWF